MADISNRDVSGHDAACAPFVAAAAGMGPCECLLAGAWAAPGVRGAPAPRAGAE
jgi:hypothetical protein